MLRPARVRGCRGVFWAFGRGRWAGRFGWCFLGVFLVGRWGGLPGLPKLPKVLAKLFTHVRARIDAPVLPLSFFFFFSFINNNKIKSLGGWASGQIVGFGGVFCRLWLGGILGAPGVGRFLAVLWLAAGWFPWYIFGRCGPARWLAVLSHNSKTASGAGVGCGCCAGLPRAVSGFARGAARIFGAFSGRYFRPDRWPVFGVFFVVLFRACFRPDFVRAPAVVFVVDVRPHLDLIRTARAVVVWRCAGRSVVCFSHCRGARGRVRQFSSRGCARS